MVRALRFTPFLGLSLAMLYSMPGLLLGQSTDPFDKKFEAAANGVGPVQPQAAVDPFDKKFEAAAVVEPKLDKPKTDTKAQVEDWPTIPKKVTDVIRFLVTASPAKARPGEVVTLTIRGTPKPGWHTYSFTKRTTAQEGLNVSKLNFIEPKDYRPLWPTRESEPNTKKEAELGFLLEHDEPFTLTQEILVQPEAKPGPLPVKMTIRLQVCKNSCIPGTIPLETTIDVQGAAVAVAPELAKRSQENRPEPIVVPVGADGTPTAGKGGSGDVNLGLVAFILTGVFWGAVSLITPCVFPMIPITVSYFLKQSEKEHHKPVTMALVYCATIVIVLTIAAVALLSFFRGLSTNPIMNFVIGGLFIYFSLSLLGMYEIELPNSLARFTSAREGQGGLAGTMFMALTFTIISFACVAPFLGGFGGTAASSNLTLLHRILGGLAFALTFASPFFILALFPTLLKKMPKSGSWLNTVKVVMGFLELAAALKFLRAGELVILPQPTLFTYDFVLGLYIALSLLAGLYLLNVYRLPHDSPVENLGVPRVLFSLVFLGLAFYLTPALFKTGERGQSQRPNGAVFAWLDSFLLPDEQESDLPWVGTLEKGLAQARLQKKLVFVDFTGKTCTNCKLNEREVFPKSNVKDLLKQYSLVALYTDVVPDKFYPPEIQAKFGNSTTKQREDADANLKFQREKFDTEQLPLYVILEPLPGGSYRVVNTYDEGRILNQSAFLEFLSKPLEANAARNDGDRTKTAEVRPNQGKWRRDYMEAWNEARKEKKPIFINFTAVTNIYAKQNEMLIQGDASIQRELDRYVRAELYIDWIPNITREEGEKQGKQNLFWLGDTFNVTWAPAYVVFQPDSDTPIDNGKLKGTTLGKWHGRIESPQEFLRFLREPRDQTAAAARSE